MRLIDADAFKESILTQSNTGYESYSTELICDFVDESPTISEQEIRNKAIEELSCKLMTYFADCQLIVEDMVERYTLDEVIKSIDEIAEQMKEVEEHG